MLHGTACDQSEVDLGSAPYDHLTPPLERSTGSNTPHFSSSQHRTNDGSQAAGTTQRSWSVADDVGVWRKARFWSYSAEV